MIGRLAGQAQPFEAGLNERPERVLSHANHPASGSAYGIPGSPDDLRQGSAACNGGSNSCQNAAAAEAFVTKRTGTDHTLRSSTGGSPVDRTNSRTPRAARQ